MKKKKPEFTIGQKIKGHFILTRPVQLIWLDVFASLAFYAVLAQHTPTAHYLLFIICAMITDGGACTINDLGDWDSDRRSTEPSRKLRPLSTGVVSKQAALYQGFILYAIGLSIALYLDFWVFVAAFLLVVISHQYAMKPLKMDGRPIISQLFWVAFGFLYFFAVSAYLIRYESLPIENIYTGLYFMLTMILFAGVGETLAKDLRDLENDKLGGKITTPVYIGPKRSAVSSFAFSLIGTIFWAIPYFTMIETPIFFQAFVVFIIVFWNGICFWLCMSIYKKYTKARSRELHLGFILTLTCILAITYFIGVT